MRVTYWLYRPTLGMGARPTAGGGERELAAAASRLNLEDDPALVPLETLAGRNHYRFPAGEQPPWRWRIPRLPGLSPLRRLPG